MNSSLSAVYHVLIVEANGEVMGEKVLLEENIGVEQAETNGKPEMMQMEEGNISR